MHKTARSMTALLRPEAPSWPEFRPTARAPGTPRRSSPSPIRRPGKVKTTGSARPTPQSREAYFRLIAEWEGLGRRFPETPPPLSNSRGRPCGVGAEMGETPVSGPTVGEIVLAYWRWVATNHRSVRASNIKAPLRLLRKLDASTPAAAFGPKTLRTLRDCMVLGDESAVPPRKPWSRRTVNERVQIIVAMFRWAVAQEMIPPSVPQALAMVEPLKRGRTTAREGARVRPVAQSSVDAVRRLVSAQVRAMIDLQLLSGVRSGEIVGLRAADLDTKAGDTWVYRPAAHKATFRGIERRV